jgi:hypothetical protein
MLALTDRDLKDEHLLHAIYDLAIKHRLDPVTDDDSDVDDTAHAPSIKAKGTVTAAVIGTSS